MIRNMNDVIWKLKNMSLNIEETLNRVNIKESHRCRLRVISPLRRIGGKVNKKIRFIHQTYANLTFVHDVFKIVSKTLEKDTRINLSSLLQPAMCILHQANRKLQCKRRNKKKKTIKTFEKTGVCVSKNRFKQSKRNCFKVVEMEDLSKIKAAENVLQGTLNFWNTCVFERKGRFGLKRKCKEKTIQKCKKKLRRNRKKNRRTKKIQKNIL